MPHFSIEYSENLEGLIDIKEFCNILRLAGIETKGNAAVVRAYKVLLNEMVQDVVDKIEKLEPINDWDISWNIKTKW